MPAAGCFGLSEAVRQILHENYAGLLSVFEEMGTIKAAVCLAVYLILALAGACAIAAERMGWETPPGEYYEMETDMSEFEGPLEEIGRIR